MTEGHSCVQVQREGWLPYHLLVRDPATEELLACSPLYLKSHSSGESQLFTIMRHCIS